MSSHQIACESETCHVGPFVDANDESLAARLWNTRAPALAARSSSEWMPIETAPKDGGTIIIGGVNYLGNFFSAEAQWRDGAWRMFHPDEDTYCVECHGPTLWRPRYEPPQGASYEQEVKG